MRKYFTKLKLSNDRTIFAKNFIALALVQGLNYLLPLLTLPYLVRVIGIEKFGILSLATAVLAFFTVITDYGFNFTATREISIFKSNKNELIKIYSSVMMLKFILMILSFILLCLIVFLVPKFSDNTIIYLLSYGIVVGQFLFPVWFFQGMERMQFITIVNIFSKTLSTICIFIFINKPEDFFLVPILSSIGSIVGGVFSLYLIHKNFGIPFVLQSKKELVKHLKDGSNLFFTSFLSTLLTSSGILILGFYASNGIVGIYSAIEKLFRAIVGLFAPITQALYPVSCKQLNNNDKQASAKYIKKLIVVMLCFTIATAALVISSAKFIIEKFYGETMFASVYILQIMMIWLIFSVMNNVLGIQYLSAKRRDKYYLKSFLMGGVGTILLNLLLIPQFSIDGILCAMIVGEIILTMAMIILIKRKGL